MAESIAHCEDSPTCIARMVEIFLQRAPSGVRNQLHGELREQLDIALASTNGPEPDMTRVAMEMLLFELKLQEQAEVFTPEDLGEALGVKVAPLLEALDGDSSAELRATSERIERRLEELLGTNHDLTIATHAEILIGDGNDQAAREAFLRAAVTSPVEARRRAYLERANRLQERMAEDETDAGS